MQIENNILYFITKTIKYKNNDIIKNLKLHWWKTKMAQIRKAKKSPECGDDEAQPKEEWQE